MSDRIVACPSCDCKIRIVLDGNAARWGCGKCKQHFELAGDTPILIAMTAQALPPQRQVAAAARQAPNRFPPPTERTGSGGSKVVIYSIAGFCAFLLAFVGAFMAVKTLFGGAGKPVVVAVDSDWRESPSVESAPKKDFQTERAVDIRTRGTAGAIPTHSSRRSGPPRWRMPQDVDGILAELPNVNESQRQQMMIRLSNHPVEPDRRRSVVDTVQPYLTSSNRIIRQFAEMTVLKWGDESDRELFWQIARSGSHEFPRALARLHEMDDPDVLKQLIKNLRESKKGRRSFPLLNSIGAEAEEMVAKAFKVSKDEKLRLHATMYLAEYGTEKSVPFFESLTDDEKAKYPLVRIGMQRLKIGNSNVVEDAEAERQRMLPGGGSADFDLHDRPGEVPPASPLATDLDGMLSQLAAGQYVSRHFTRLSGGGMRRVTPQERDKIIETVAPFIDDKRTRRTAALIVYRYGEPKHRDVFWKIAKSGDVTFGQALEKLVKMGDADVIPHLIKMLSDKQWGGTAISILKKAGPKAEQPLIDAFESIEDVRVKVSAVKFFIEHGTEKSVPLLESLAEANDPFIGPLAKRSLEKIE